jgi:rRNA-processing protein FCF1
MPAKEKVIFDTNILRNTASKSFLGGREELERFAEFADIIFPEIVIRELKTQKKKALAKHQSTFLDNPFCWLLGLDSQKAQDFDCEAHLAKLETDETIPYAVISLTDYSVLPKMMDMAINKEAPFEDSEKTDKGFKDACIYFAILEYLGNNPSERIFVCTKDVKLKEALGKHEQIKVIRDFEEFRRESISTYYQEYFIQKLQLEVDPRIEKEHILDFWYNIDGNKVIEVAVEEDRYLIETDAGEIIKTANRSHYNVNRLIHSGSFRSTHIAVAELDQYKTFFSDEEIIRILQATIENSQIISDEDVQQFILDIYGPKKHIVDRELAHHIEMFLS